MPKGLGTAIMIKRIEISADEKTVERAKELAWHARLSTSAYFRKLVEKEWQQLQDHQN